MRLGHARLPDSLCQLMTQLNAPAMAIIRCPILHDPKGWGILLSPLRTIRHWIGLPARDEMAHAIVVYEIDGQTATIFDPAYGTHHSVDWERLNSWLTLDAFPQGPFLFVTESPVISSVNFVAT